MTVSSFEAHWRRWPDFRRRVSEARAFASLYLGAALEAEREGPFEFTEHAETLPPPSIAEAIRLARRHRQGRR